MPVFLSGIMCELLSLLSPMAVINLMTMDGLIRASQQGRINRSRAGVRRSKSAAASLPSVTPAATGAHHVFLNEDNYADVRIPFLTKHYFPFDFFATAEAIEIKDITDAQVFSWDHRFSPLIDFSSVPVASEEDKKRVHKCVNDMRKLCLADIRIQIRSRMVRLCKQFYPDDCKYFTNFKQVVDHLNLEIASGRGEKPFEIIYQKWPRLWDNAFENRFCKGNNIVMREWICKGKQYKGLIAKLVSYAMGNIRSNFKKIKRRQAAQVVDGRKVRRRNKHKAKFDPEIHLRHSPKKERNFNGKREM